MINLMSDEAFSTLRNLLNCALYRKLHAEGLGCAAKTEVLTDEDEVKLWESSILDPGMPQGLLNWFFLNGKTFACAEA